MTKLRLRLAGLVVALIAAVAGAAEPKQQRLNHRYRRLDDTVRPAGNKSSGTRALRRMISSVIVAGADVIVERPVEGI